MNAPATTPLWSKCSRIILPNRLELLLRTVFALPKASRIGLDERIACVLACACASEVRLRRSAPLAGRPRAYQPVPSLPACPKPTSLSQAYQPVPSLPACPEPAAPMPAAPVPCWPPRLGMRGAEARSSPPPPAVPARERHARYRIICLPREHRVSLPGEAAAKRAGPCG